MTSRYQPRGEVTVLIAVGATAGALGKWPITIICGGVVVILAILASARFDDPEPPSGLRRRQLERLAERDRVEW